jgi:hypothetical protein
MERTGYIWWWGLLCQLYHRENKLHMMMRSALSAISWREQVTYDEEVRFVSYIMERTSYIWWWGLLLVTWLLVALHCSPADVRAHILLTLQEKNTNKIKIEKTIKKAKQSKTNKQTKQANNITVKSILYDIAVKAGLIIICNLFSPWYSWQSGPHHHM